MQTIGRGGEITLDANFTDGAGVLTDATPVTVDIINPSDVEVVSNASPTTNPSTGHYTYDYTVATDAPLGVWTIRWEGVVNSVAVSGTESFEVVAAGSVDFDGTSLASFEEFEERHGPVDASEEDRVSALLVDASALILDEAAGSTAGWVAEGDPAPQVIKAVCIAAVYRAWSNPDAASQITHADSSLSYTRNANPDALYLTSSEKTTIRKSASLSTIGSITLVTPYSGDEETVDPDVGDL